MNKSTMHWRLIALGIIVIVLGIIAYLPFELPRIGEHPIDLFKIVPGYVIIVLGILIIVITVAYNFIADRKSALPTPLH